MRDPAREPAHMPQLDGLRAVAVGAVIFHHTTAIGATGRTLGWTGPAAVWLFFALSGFLITGILADAREAAGSAGSPRLRAWGAFWARRALRIFPLYYAVLLVAALGLGSARQDWPWLAAYASNLRYAWLDHWPGSMGHTWSLSVEEQFYLAWPVFCLALPRRRLLAVALAAAAAAPAARVLLERSWGGVAAEIATPCCLDALGLGAALALTRWRPPAWVAAIGVLLSLAPIPDGLGWMPRFPGWALGRTGWAVASCWLVGGAAAGFGGPFGRLLRSAPLRSVGRVSYGVYLLHPLVQEIPGWCHYRLGMSLGYPAEPGPTRCLYVAAVTLGLASLSWHLFERPLNDLKRHFPYVRHPQASLWPRGKTE